MSYGCVNGLYLAEFIGSAGSGSYLYLLGIGSALRSYLHVLPIDCKVYSHVADNYIHLETFQELLHFPKCKYIQ